MCIRDRHTQDAIVDDSCDRQHIEASSKLSPNAYIVPSLALVVKSVHPVDRLALVIATQQVEVLRELYLVRQEQCNGLNALLASIDIVANKQKLLVVLRVSSNVKQSE